MSLPVLHGIGRLTSDPELKFTQTGLSFVKINLAFNSRKKDESGNWVDGDVFFVTGTLWKEHAENAAETLTKGMEVVISGKLRTESWTTDDGLKRSTAALSIDFIAPSLRFATATVTKTERNGQAARSPRTEAYSDPSEPPF